MGNELTQKQIDDFYAYLDTLGLKFPVAAISKATGYSKGNVSEYLNRNLTPSQNFLNKFYEAFPKSYKKVPRETENAPESDFKPQQGHDSAMDTIRNLAEGNRKIADANASLAKSNEELTLMVKQSVNVQSENLEVFGATLATLREFVLDLCMKSKTHRSRDEARAAFRIRLGEFLKNSKGVDIRSDLSK